MVRYWVAGSWDGGMVREMKTPLSFGRHDLMAVAAVRYCLGRMTYIVGDCADWLIEQWPNLTLVGQRMIIRDVEDAFTLDDRARNEGLPARDYRRLGHDCDRAQWERVRRLWVDDGKLT